jgi:hypothetical protein
VNTAPGKSTRYNCPFLSSRNPRVSPAETYDPTTSPASLTSRATVDVAPGTSMVVKG